jgi:comB
MEEEKEKKNKTNNNNKNKGKIKNKKNNSKKQEITSGNTIESSLENIINTNTANTLDSGNNNQNNKNNNNSNSNNKKNNNKKNKKIKSAAGEIDDLDDLDHSQYASNIDEIDTLTKKDAEKENNNKDKIVIKSKDDKRVVLDAVGKLKVDDVETEEQLDKLQEKTNKKLKEIEEKKEAISDEKFEENIQKKVIEKLGNRHKKKILLITTIIVLIAICVISTIFSVIYMGKDVIVPNIYVGSINIGGLTKEEAKDKILKIYEEKATKDIRASLKDYEQIIKTEMVEFVADVSKAVDNAYMIGRNGNIIENNYTIISRYFNNKNIEISYHVNEELMKKLLEEIAGKIPEKVKEPSYNIDGTKLLVYPGTRGYEVNKLSLREMIVSIMLDVDKKTEEDLKITIPVDLKEPNNIDIEKIHNEIYEKPENATYNEETKELKLDKDGLDFAITMEEAKNIIRENKEEYTIPLKKVKADITYDKLGKDIFPDLLRNISNKL